MALEDLTGTGKGIDAFVATNPDGLDPRSEGDNHIRGIKNVLINVFGAMVSKITSAPAVGQVLRYDGAKYAPSHNVPVGTIFDFAGAGSVPAGFLACDGSTVSRTTYAALFAVLSTTWNTGGEAGTDFRLPNFNRRVAVGSGGSGTGTLGNAVGNIGGAETHTLTTGQVPNLNIPLGDNSAGGSNITFGFGAMSTNVIFNASTNNGGGGSHNIMQPAAVVKKIISTGLLA